MKCRAESAIGTLDMATRLSDDTSQTSMLQDESQDITMKTIYTDRSNLNVWHRFFHNCPKKE